jgi:hypothetical protein
MPTAVAAVNRSIVYEKADPKMVDEGLRLELLVAPTKASKK